MTEARPNIPEEQAYISDCERELWYDIYSESQMEKDYEQLTTKYSNMNTDALKQQAGSLEPDPFSSIRKQSAQAGVSQGPATINKSSMAEADMVPNWVTLHAPENRIGLVRATFTDFAKPGYGFGPGNSYRLMVYSYRDGVAIWNTEGGQYRSPAIYQSWKEFFRNWTKVTYIHPADTLLDEIDRLEKTSEANRDSLRKLRSEVQDFKYDR